MNIGILRCGNVSEELRSHHGEYHLMFAALLNGVDQSLSFTLYDVEHGNFPSHIDACDAYLISGSRHGVNDGYPWIATLEEFVRQLFTAQKKVIGICFGHQLIAKALGGEVIKSPKGWGVGMSSNTIIQKKPWMTPDEDKINILVSHQDQVVKLPPGAEVLAESEHCPIYMMQIGNNFTIQGHPEFSKSYSRALMERRKEVLDKARYDQGIQSLQMEEDDQLIAQWIINFLKNTH